MEVAGIEPTTLLYIAVFSGIYLQINAIYSVYRTVGERFLYTILLPFVGQMTEK